MEGIPGETGGPWDCWVSSSGSLPLEKGLGGSPSLRRKLALGLVIYKLEGIPGEAGAYLPCGGTNFFSLSPDVVNAMQFFRNMLL